MVHIKSSGEYAWREDLYDRVGEQLCENTRSGAIDGACEFTEQMIPALEAAVEHPDMTEELADLLSTSMVEIEYRIQSGVTIDESEPNQSSFTSLCNRRRGR